MFFLAITFLEIIYLEISPEVWFSYGARGKYRYREYILEYKCLLELRGITLPQVPDCPIRYLHFLPPNKNKLPLWTIEPDSAILSLDPSN